MINVFTLNLRIYITLLFLILITNVKGQSDPRSESDFRKYILEHLDDYDPIVGVYSLTGYLEKYVDNKYIDTTPLQIMEKIAIIRKGSNFVKLNIPNNVETSNYIYSTASDGNYIMDGTNFRLDNQMSFSSCYFESNENVADMMSISIRDVRNFGVKVKVCTKYTKLFPSKWDIESYLKAKSNEVPKIKNSTGSGFLISNEGIIVTNFHVVENSRSIFIRGINDDFSQKHRAEILYSDKNSDLALLKLSDSYLKINGKIPYFFKSNMSEVGESIFVLGYPLTATMGEEIKLTDGIISSKSGFQGDISTYQITAPIQPGNSGAPLFDKRGNLIGIINAKHKNTDNVGYAIKLIYLNNIIESIPIKTNTPIKNELNTIALTEIVKRYKNYVYIIEVELN